MSIKIQDNIIIPESNGCNGTIAIGLSPLCSLITTTACNNIAIGNLAGYNLTIGSCNTILGNVSAPSPNSSGLVLIGTHTTERLRIDDTSMTLNQGIKIGTTGLDNFFIGKCSLQNVQIGNSPYNCISSGYENMGIGSYTLQCLTSGKWNIAIGDGSSTRMTTQSSNIGIGRGSLMFAQADCNIAIGLNALSSNASDTYPPLTGSGNVGIGIRTLQSNVSGNNNITLGHGSLGSLVSGDYNIAIGNNTGCSLVSSCNNTIIGNIVGTSNLSNTVIIASGSCSRIKIDDCGMVLNSSMRIGALGNENVFFGTCALKSLAVSPSNTYLEQGNGNTAIGATAMQNLTTGNLNVAVGDDTLFCTQTGNDNVAIGHASLMFSEGDRNIAIGSLALGSTNCNTYSQMTGNDNIAIGKQTLFKNINGCRNIGIGTSTLYNILSGNNNLVIGYSAGCNLSGGDSNNTVIGNIPAASGSNAVYLGSGNCQRLKIDNTGMYINDTLIPIGTSGVLGLDTYNSLKVGAGALSTSSGVNNLAIGVCSLYCNSSGNNNIGIGCFSLRNNTDGDNNVAMGYNTLSKNTIGNNNIAIGNSSLYQNNSTGNNIALGYCAGCDITTGTNNTIIGNIPGTGNCSDTVLIGAGTTQRLRITSSEMVVNDRTRIGSDSYENTFVGTGTLCHATQSTTNSIYGTRNTAFGQLAMAQITTGYHNIAIGDDSMELASTSNYNISIGDASLRCGDTIGNVAIGHGTLWPCCSILSVGNCNTTIGNWSLRYNKCGNNNVAVGYCAMYGNSSGCDNVAIGLCALPNSTSGNKNVIIGSCTGNNMTTASYNTVIGNFTNNNGAFCDPTSSNMSNTILIGAGCNYLKIDGTGGLTISGNPITASINLDSTGNLSIGCLALSCASHGNNNIAIGCSSLTNNTGNCNIALGFCAGCSITTGANNTIIGNIPGTNNCSDTVLIGAGTTERLRINAKDMLINNLLRIGADSSENTFIGYRALCAIVSSSTSGLRNMAIGSTTLSKLTTGNDNMAIGDDAMGETCTGTRNIAIGTASLRYGDSQGNIAIGINNLGSSNSSVTPNTGNYNTSIGHSGLYSNQTGGCNTAFGYCTLYRNTIGYENIAVGYGALFCNICGNKNIVIGSCTGNKMVSASYNTVIGNFSTDAIGTYCDPTTSGMTNTILIGAGCNRLQVDSCGVFTVNGCVISASASLDTCGNLAIGANALSKTPHGVDNIAIGCQSLFNVTGSCNIALGKNAGCNLITGVNNTILGNLSGTISTSDTVLIGAGCTERLRIDNSVMLLNNRFRIGADSSTNTFVGAGAMSTVSTGTNNLAVGYNSLTTLSTGSNNTAIGVNAMCNASSSWNNIAIGMNSLMYGDSCCNIAIGNCTLTPNRCTTGVCTPQTGSFNTTIGHYSLGLNTSGSCNTAFGNRALYCNTTGIENTVIGFCALPNSTTGNKNVVIGSCTGYNMTTASYNTVIGYFASNTSGLYSDPTTPGMTNTILIGAGCNKLKVDSCGAFTINDTPISASTLNPLASYQMYSVGIGTTASCVQGEIRAFSTITSNYSDDRLKTKHGNITNALDKILTLNGFYYNANDVAQSLGYSNKIEVGVSAQEVQAILPEVVVPAPVSDDYLTVHYEKLIPLIIEAIKELNLKVTDLK